MRALPELVHGQVGGELTMKNTTFAFGPVVGEREDGAPVDYARYGTEVRDQLAETDIMLAVILDNEDEQQGFDPYNPADA
jgi:hypothetical protein